MISTQTKVFATSLTPLKTFCYSRRNFFYHFLLHQKSKKDLRWQLRIGYLQKYFYLTLTIFTISIGLNFLKQHAILHKTIPS